MARSGAPPFTVDLLGSGAYDSPSDPPCKGLGKKSLAERLERENLATAVYRQRFQEIVKIRLHYLDYRLPAAVAFVMANAAFKEV